MKIVAELSANHLGSFNRACAIVDAAKAAGAAAVKLQTWTPGTMVLDPEARITGGRWDGLNMAELYAEAQLPWKAQEAVFEYARAHSIECFSSVFDTGALAFLEGLRCPRYKIASFELVDLPLIRAVAATRKPIILSTGMAYKGEIDEAVHAARSAGATDITLLRCTSAYPADASEANLATMVSMARLWSCQPGLSDHTEGIGVAVTAAALGATMIEKHVTLARDDGGLDAAFSIEPAELALLVREARRAERALGNAAAYGPGAAEKPQLGLRRSLHFTADLEAGTTVERQHLCTARPAAGVAPRLLAQVVGGKTTTAVRAGLPVTWDVVERNSPIPMILKPEKHHL